jgi:aryl carrier-like protein
MNEVECSVFVSNGHCGPGTRIEVQDRGTDLADGYPQAVLPTEPDVYTIERQSLGFKLVFQGSMPAREMQEWLDDSIVVLREPPPSFGLLIDMRALLPLTLDSQRLMSLGHQLYQRRGLRRSAVVVQSSGTRLQFNRLAKESGAYQWERYISAEDTPDWETRGWAWIQGGFDPDAS